MPPSPHPPLPSGEEFARLIESRPRDDHRLDLRWFDARPGVMRRRRGLTRWEAATLRLPAGTTVQVTLMPDRAVVRCYALPGS